jgi:hypothetical protein
MSLLEALLLDPARVDVWVAIRAAGTGSGTGTQVDPYDGSTATKFDALMRSMAVNTCVHLGPGEFETEGYHDNIAQGHGWQAQPGMRIVGSGIDVTKLKLVSPASSGQRAYAVAHPLSSSTVDFFELSGLTINCNWSGQASGVAAGAVRIMGNHSRVVRVKVMNWGVKAGGPAGFVIAMLTGDPGNGVNSVTNCGIEECIVVVGDLGESAADPVTVLHVGGKETAASPDEAFGLGPYIRNCFVDCGQTPPFTREFRALSMAWCRGGVVEGNQIHNTKYGGPHQTATGARDLAVRNSAYRNVWKGPYWSMASQGVQRLVVEGNSIELATGAASSDYAIQLDSGATPPSYAHGNVVIRDNRIRYVDGGSGSAGGIKAWSAQNLQVRENTVELAPATPLMHKNCGAAQYFENRTPAGVLVRGYNESTSLLCSELETDAEDAFILGMIKNP